MNEVEKNEKPTPIQPELFSLDSIEKTNTGDSFQCMIDIETWDLAHTSAIFAISYVIFKKDESDLSKSIKYFRTLNINKFSQIELYGRTVSEKTETFWNRPSLLQVRKVLEKNGLELKNALSIMCEELSKLRINEFWANSPTFDMMILESAFKATNLEKYIPWKFFQLRDVRTITSLITEKLGRIENKPFVDSVLKLNIEKDYMLLDYMVEHHPLFDCFLQINRVIFFNEKTSSKNQVSEENNELLIPVQVPGKKLKIELTFIE